MNKLVKASMISLAAVAVLSMTGCGSDDSSSGASANGTAADGYINGATVCIDINGSGQCTNNSTTTNNGTYSLPLDSKEINQSKAAHNGVVIFNVIGGTDIDTNKTLVGTLRAPFNDKNKSAAVNITPLTTLVAITAQQYGNISKAYSKVAQVFGLTLAELQADPIKLAKEKNDTKVLAKSFILNQIITATVDNNSSADNIYKGLANYIVTSNDKNLTATKLIVKAKNNLPSDINTSKLESLSLVLASDEKLIEEGNTTIIKTVAKKADMNNSALTSSVNEVVKSLPNIKLGQIKFASTKNPAEQNETNLTASDLTKYTFAETNITKSSDSNISDFNLTLADINVTKAFAKQVATLDIKVVDDSNDSKNISLSIPGIVIDGNTTDFNITIPKDANATFKQSEVNITEKNTTNFIFSKAEVFKSKDNNLSISVGNLLTDMNVSDNTKNNLNNYFDKNRTYKLTVEFNGVDTTEVVLPTLVSGKVGIINK